MKKLDEICFRLHEKQQQQQRQQQQQQHEQQQQQQQHEQQQFSSISQNKTPRKRRLEDKLSTEESLKEQLNSTICFTECDLSCNGNGCNEIDPNILLTPFRHINSLISQESASNNESAYKMDSINRNDAKEFSKNATDGKNPVNSSITNSCRPIPTETFMTSAVNANYEQRMNKPLKFIDCTDDARTAVIGSSFHYRVNEKTKEQRLLYNCAKCGYKAINKTKGLLHLKLHDKTDKLQAKTYELTQQTNKNYLS
ncbi:hypothetical protein LOAG_13309 [Loa loa]|uniref:C2H2-type domain-containing protein n=1 Tax=Loa loa TaxID=7209 RepID=A0A1S0TKQ1_LOALO|nr:hypothetical protein LOAG_13309 [Loa loa]EFO15203.1 hypothetical protein LOAG_13309 [Loa loa]